jgi:hypothetical protein
MSIIDPLPLTDFRSSEDVPPPTNPTEIDMLSRLMYMYDEARRYKSQWTGSWKRNWEFYIGRQWGPRAHWKASPVENYVFSKVETMLPILTDNRPRIHVLPRQQEFMEYADSMQDLISYLWDRLNMDDVVVEVTKNMLLFGKGFYYTYWDYEQNEIACESVDPHNIFVNRDATSIEDAHHVIHVSRMSKEEILARWPDARGLFKMGARTVLEPYEKTGLGRISEHEAVTAGSAYDDPGAVQGTVPWVKADLSDAQSEDDLVQVLQFWIRDQTQITEELVQKNGKPFKDKKGDAVMVEKAKYPRGRHMIMAGNRIIHDDENPFAHGQFPYIEQDCHRIPGEFWSVSAVQNLLSPQMELNKALGQVIDNKNLMGNAQWIVSRNSGIDPSQITAQPGLVIEKAPGSEVERVDAPNMPNYIMQFIEGRKQALDDISGVFDVTQGRKPSGITAGIAIESLQEAAQTRLRALVRNLENAIGRNGRQWVGLAQQHYDQARQVRVTDHQTGQFRFVELTPEAINGQWEVIVAAGSTLPRSREVRQSQGVELFQLGIFDEEALLEWLDHPGRDRVLSRIRERRQKQQDLQNRGLDLQESLGQGQQ